MSLIGKNIKKIRVVKKLSQADFAQLFNLARPSVGAYEEGRSEPKIDTLIDIAKYFNLSTDALLTKELTINELYKFDIFKAAGTQTAPVINDKDEIREQTPLVMSEQALEYIVNHKNHDFINALPVISFPFTESPRSRAFQVDGKEMEFENCGIHHQDILLCDQVKPDDEMQIGSLYVLVADDGIRVRRLSDHSKNLTFKTDDPSFDLLVYSRNALLEIWEVRAYFSRRLEAPSRLEERVASLEKKLEDLLLKKGNGN